MIEIEKERVSALMDVFSSDYRSLAEHLRLMQDRMVLINPRFESYKEE